MRKKGFVLVELLSVVVILAIILVITIPTVANIMYSVRLNSFMADEKMMIWVSKKYLSTNGNYLPINLGDTVEIRLSQLQSEGLISNIMNPWNNSDACDGYILVTKVDTNMYDYNPYLKCESNYKVGDYLSDGLVASWELNGNAYDYTPNNNQGTIQNVAATTNRFGIENAALGFAGPSNFVDTNLDFSFNYGSGSTFSLWVKFSTINTSGKTKNIFGKNSWEYLLSQIDNKIKFTQWASDGSYALQLVSNINLQTDRWYNIVIVYNSLDKAVYLYIDGILDNYDSILSTTFADKKESLKVGRGYPDVGAASSTFFVGSIDNLCVYNRAWSEYEVKLNYDIDKLMSR